MILTKLHLENFKKYTSYDIEFGEGLIGIIGKNGSGKSTIFEAILFALFGEAKKRGNKDLLRNAGASAKDAVVVELEFEFEDALYKVIREFRGKAMSANAKLLKNGEVTTTGAKEVTTAITKLTGMGKDAFMHTLFASQKELASLSTLKNEERKKMIRRLLGLEKIDFVEKELVEKSRELGREIKAFAEVLLSDEDIKAKQELIKQNKEKKHLLVKDEQNKTKELISLKDKESVIKKELDVFVKTKELKQKLYAGLELISSNKSIELINQAKLIAENYELEHKQEELNSLANVKKEYLGLQEDLKKQEGLKEKHLKREGLQKEQVQLRERYSQAKADIHKLEKECELHEQYSFDAKNLEQDLSIRQDGIEAKHTIEQEILIERASEQRIIDETNAKIQSLEELGSESECPTCTRPLLEEYDKVINSLNSIVQGTHQKKIDEYNTQLKNVQEQKAKLIEQRKVKEKEFQELSKNLNIITSKLQDLQKAKEHFKEIELKGLKNKDELKELEVFKYDASVHEKLQKNNDVLTPKYKHILSLETELKRHKAVKIDLAKVNENIEKLTKEHQEKELEFQKVVYDENAHKQKVVQHEQALKSVEEQTETIHDIKVEVTRIDGDVKNTQSSLDNNEEQLKKVQTKKDDLQDYEKIKTSLAEFKTRLNSKVAPRISTIASDMYSRITKGKYQHIEVSNDFDFFIYDEGKKYPIERFSGGEIDLANLVLRIAISKTLTELSGASSIGFLAFDEVFGSQDESRRMEILEAFHTIKEQYRQIFLISHEMEIKEMFERLVEL
ncbi:SMC family ATPase [Sulfurimonas lithotrophica]|uniref:SMC family ATPase n=1 Tax=Sulfurimonas lithotrophica TaxID=2590022 RepID=A0A5P8P0G0_9BACT|nr:SMC family ATPase [Sulfurimonas lithotrophica]QFR49195.1 SMC family ATPase [Sulfurimonas lithotrophica]